jgi:glutamate racemase
VMHDTLRKILHPLRHAEALLLACTHYPAIRHLIAPLVPEAELLDPSVLTAQDLLAYRDSLHSNGRQDIFLTTGDPHQSTRVAAIAFGTKVDHFIKVEKGLGAHKL